MTQGYLDKNKDTLFVDLVNSMAASKSPLLKVLFPPPDINSKKRPITAGTQFKARLINHFLDRQSALQALMDKLLACEPHYIRCIKPNDDKRAGFLNEERVRHQIRYLG
jgi:myosin-1